MSFSEIEVSKTILIWKVIFFYFIYSVLCTARFSIQIHSHWKDNLVKLFLFLFLFSLKSVWTDCQCLFYSFAIVRGLNGIICSFSLRETSWKATTVKLIAIFLTFCSITKWNFNLFYGRFMNFYSSSYFDSNLQRCELNCTIKKNRVLILVFLNVST